MNTVKNPLILKYSGSIYRVNKPDNQDGEYVDLEIAKELLEALEGLRDMLDNHYGDDEDETPLINRAFEAIAKAKGE